MKQILSVHRCGCIASVLFLMLGLPVVGSAYVLPLDTVLSYMTKNRPEGAGLEIKQVVEFGEGIAQPERLRLDEACFFDRGGAFRCEAKAEALRVLWMHRGGRVLGFTDGALSQDRQRPSVIWQDLFMAPNAEALKSSLESLGIQTGIESLTRSGPKVALVIGAKDGDLSRPQIWVDRDTFQPQRLFVSSGGSDLIELRFSRFGEKCPSWFPGQTEIFQAQQRLATMEATSGYFRGSLAPNLFDLEEARRKSTASAKLTREPGFSAVPTLETLAVLRAR